MYFAVPLSRRLEVLFLKFKTERGDAMYVLGIASDDGDIDGSVLMGMKFGFVLPMKKLDPCTNNVVVLFHQYKTDEDERLCIL